MESDYQVTVQSDSLGSFTDYVLRSADGQELLVCADTTQDVFGIFNVSMDGPSPEMLIYGLTASFAQALCTHTRNPGFALNSINNFTIPQE